MASRVNPGPEDTSLLHLQPYHVSEHLWHGVADRFLRVRRAQKHKHVDPPAEILPYLQAAGFSGLAHLGYFPVDNVFISALVERWRPETHTFHVLTGECTITLEDVAILTGLPVDGTAVTGHSNLDWKDLCDRLLGVVPPDHALSGGRLSMSWLSTMYDHILDDADDEFLKRYARAYILRLIGGMLLPDHSGRFVHLMYLPLLSDFTIAGTYSWGSACLSFLYRELCKATDYDMHEIGGACFLLQIWAWVRFPRLAPTLSEDDTTLDNHKLDRAHLRPFGFKWHRHKMLSESSTHLLKYYRHHFDRLKKDEIAWQPYTADIISALPSSCTAGSDIWRAVVPLVCFHIIEWHQPGRVLRQFGLDQPIPKWPHQPEHLHSITLKGRHDDFWPDVHKDYIALWDTRRELCIKGRALDGALSTRSDYMRWYRRITRRWISPTTATLGVVADVAEQLYGWATEFRSGFSMDSLRQSAELILFALDEHDRIARTQLQTPPPDIIPGSSEDDTQERMTHRRRRGLAENRRRVQHSETSESSSQHPPPPPPQPTVTTNITPPIQPPPSYYPCPPYPYPLPYPYPAPYPYPPPYPYVSQPGYSPYPHPSQPGYPPYPHPSQPGPSFDPSYKPP